MNDGFIIWWKALATGLISLGVGIFILVFAYYWRSKQANGQVDRDSTVDVVWINF